MSEERTPRTRTLMPEQELAEAKKRAIPYGSERHQQMLATAYDFASVAEARDLVTKAEKGLMQVPYQDLRRARSLLAQIEAKPRVVSTRPVWKRVDKAVY